MLQRLNRRDFVRLSAAVATALNLPALRASAQASHETPLPESAGPLLYSRLLRTWCDGLLAHQVSSPSDPALLGGFLCPSCALIHGRCADAVYPLLRMAHSSGDDKYLHAAMLAFDWSERQVSQSDGSWINDVTLSSWKGITVFRVIAMSEALLHYGSLLDAPTRQRWIDRLARAAAFLDTYITMQTGNINYPVTSSLSFALAGQVLGESRYQARANDLAHASLEYITESGLLYGEGHPLDKLSPKGYRPVDLGYNVEESLPALALYSVIAQDKVVRGKVVAALRSHMEFMLPDGSWDNSWGTRNYKWSWWGSRTSDGCQPAFVLLSQDDPRFLEVARRNTLLMASCTHNGLLYGGPQYYEHGELPCIHHAFTHAKALATVLDRGEALLQSSTAPALPRDGVYEVKSFKEIGVHLASVGEWRATVTDYDWEYFEQVQSGGAGSGGGHASGGALSLLYHRVLGPVLAASMTEYQMVEISNQQVVRHGSQITLTPRVEYTEGTQTYTSLSDLRATLSVEREQDHAAFRAKGRLQTAGRRVPPGSQISYALDYILKASSIVIQASIQSDRELPGSALFLLPVISAQAEPFEMPTRSLVRIRKPGGILSVRTTASEGFSKPRAERAFNLVPGFECLPLAIRLQRGEAVQIVIEMAPPAPAANA